MRITQGTFSYLPDLTDDEIRAQIQYAIDQGWAVAVEFTDDPHPRNVLWEMWGLPMFGIADAAAAMHEVTAVPRRLPRPLHPGVGLRRQPGPADHRAELHREPARHRARVPAGPAGGLRPAHPLLASPLRRRSAAPASVTARGTTDRPNGARGNP